MRGLGRNADPFEDDAFYGSFRFLPIVIGQGRAVVEGLDLVAEIGVVLGGGPDEVKEVAWADRVHQAIGDPLIDDFDPPIGPFHKRGFKVVLDDGGAVHDL